MTIWPPRPDTISRPAYRSVADCLVRAVEAGELKPGDKLPTHRNLAYDLDLSVQTVSRAYEELIRNGYISGQVGRGTYVADVQSEVHTPFTPLRRQGKMIDCSILKPVFDPMHMNTMREALQKLATDLPLDCLYSARPSAAVGNYSDTARRWLARCGVSLNSQSLLLTNGNTQAMTLALMTTVRPGELVVTEELGHHTLKALSRYLGLRIQGLETDDEGIVPDAFAKMCRQTTVRAIYLLPTALNPRSTTMSVPRRQEIVRIARKNDVFIIESDAWGPMQAIRPEAFATLAPERTFYFTSFTKGVLPGLRLGYLVMPETFESAVSNRHMVTNWVATPLMAELASRWIEDGTAAYLLQWQKLELAKRNKMARKIFNGIKLNGSECGMHVWLPMTGGWTDDAFVAHARLNGVAIAPGSSFQLADHCRHSGVRICLGPESPEALERGLMILDRLARSEPEPALLTL